MKADSSETGQVDRQPRRYRSDRMVGLSDGVFAFAITLLVLDLTVPSLTGSDVVQGLLGDWPKYLAYVISFATIGAVWLAHAAITDHLDHADSKFLRFNLLVLLFVSFMPYPTRFLSAFFGAEEPERFAVSFYGICVLILTGMVWMLWAYARHRELFDEDTPEDLLVLFTQRMIPGILAYVVLIVVGWFVPAVALVGYGVIALWFIFPIRIRRSKTGGVPQS